MNSKVTLRLEIELPVTTNHVEGNSLTMIKDGASTDALAKITAKLGTFTVNSCVVSKITVEG